MPSSAKAYNAIKDMLHDSNAKHFVDLGSGWGNLVIRLAKDFPEKHIYGYELSWLPWCVSVIMKHIYQLDNVTLKRENFLTAEWPQNSTLICYLFPNVMHKVEQKITVERPNIDYVVCNNFMLPNNKPTKKTQINDFYRSPIYLYKITKKL